MSSGVVCKRNVYGFMLNRHVQKRTFTNFNEFWKIGKIREFLRILKRQATNCQSMRAAAMRSHVNLLWPLVLAATQGRAASGGGYFVRDQRRSHDPLQRSAVLRVCRRSVRLLRATACLRPRRLEHAPPITGEPTGRPKKARPHTKLWVAIILSNLNRLKNFTGRFPD